MKIKDILKEIEIKEIIGNTDIEIDNLTQDTREDFTEKTLYFAVPGTQVDGHDFIDQAIEKGSVAVVCEEIPDQIWNDNKNNNDVSFIVVDSVSESMGHMVSNFYGNPSKKLKVLAVTGTNGKTSIATLLYQSLLKLGKKAALFSTAGDFINGEEIKTKKKASSSMEVIELQKNLALAVENECDYVCIEATSHALDQNRLDGTKIVGAIFTNLTQDHLDYHKNFEHYAEAKQKLFSFLDEGAFALVNIDDPYGAKMVEKTKAEIISYGDAKKDNPIRRDHTFKIKEFGEAGTKILFDGNELSTNLVGNFNMYNLLAVYVSLLTLGFKKEDIIRVIKEIPGARGRMEIVKGNKKNGVIGMVDYAHTPDALENVLQTLKGLVRGRIITVVGVGGDRDRKKRPQMAKIAQTMSDYVVFTSDNPRTEDPKQIFSDLLEGADSKKENFEKIENREEAIKRAVEISDSGDIILVAGKGHEDYQIIGTTKHHFDDVEVLKKYL